MVLPIDAVRVRSFDPILSDSLKASFLAFFSSHGGQSVREVIGLVSEEVPLVRGNVYQVINERHSANLIS